MPNDAAPARHPFLRKTVDLIDRAALNHVDPAVRQAVLERFVQDFQRHATGPMVELGRVLGELVDAAGFDEEDSAINLWLRKEHSIEDLDGLKDAIEEWKAEGAMPQEADDIVKAAEENDLDADGIRTLWKEREDLAAKVAALEARLSKIRALTDETAES